MGTRKTTICPQGEVHIYAPAGIHVHGEIRADSLVLNGVERFREADEAGAEQRSEWQCTSQSEYCMGLEQLNRILVGLVRQYGTDGKLTMTNDVKSGVKLGAQVRWYCTGERDEYIVIRETPVPPSAPEPPPNRDAREGSKVREEAGSQT